MLRGVCVCSHGMPTCDLRRVGVASIGGCVQGLRLVRACRTGQWSFVLLRPVGAAGRLVRWAVEVSVVMFKTIVTYFLSIKGL